MQRHARLARHDRVVSVLTRVTVCVGRPRGASQAECRGFESLHPLREAAHEEPPRFAHSLVVRFESLGVGLQGRGRPLPCTAQQETPPHPRQAISPLQGSAVYVRPLPRASPWANVSEPSGLRSTSHAKARGGGFILLYIAPHAVRSGEGLQVRGPPLPCTAQQETPPHLQQPRLSGPRNRNRFTATAPVARSRPAAPPSSGCDEMATVRRTVGFGFA